jgi:hypothetical protein
MSNLLAEIALRLAKAVAAAIVGSVLYLFLTVLLGMDSSVELALLCWLSGAAFVLLVESSPL